MTDEKCLHEMMADPGPAPDHDANGWPVTVGARVRHDRLGLGWVRGLDADGAQVVWDAARITGLPIAVDRLTVVPRDGDPYTAGSPTASATAVGLGPITVAGVVHKPGIFIPDDSDQHSWVCRTCTDDVLMPAWPCDAVADAVGRRSIHTVSTASGGFSVGHFAEFDYAGEAIVGVVESIGPDGSLTLGCGPEGRWVMPVAECRPWGPPLGALPGVIPTEADGRPAFRPGDRVEWVVDGVTNGNGTVRQYPYRDAFIRPTLALVHFDGDPEPLTALIQDLTLIPTNPAGPAPSSASTSGTGGPAEPIASVETKWLRGVPLPALIQEISNRIEGQRRELWDEVVASARRAEQPFSQEGEPVWAAAFQSAYRRITGVDGEELERHLAGEMDDRYGADRQRAGGGEQPC